MCFFVPFTQRHSTTPTRDTARPKVQSSSNLRHIRLPTTISGFERVQASLYRILAPTAPSNQSGMGKSDVSMHHHAEQPSDSWANGPAMPHTRSFRAVLGRYTINRIMVALCTVTAFLACTLVLKLVVSLPYAQIHSSRQDGYPFGTLFRYAVAASAPLLQVFQIYPPVLTVKSNDVLEITDGSANVSIATVGSSTKTCQQTLVVHSFAYSYGEPFVGWCSL